MKEEIPTCFSDLWIIIWVSPIGVLKKFLGCILRTLPFYLLGPFTYMQEEVAMAKMDAIAKEASKKDSSLVVPMIHALFADSANTNLEVESAAFREQCYLKHKLTVKSLH
ncbi:MAG: CoA-substrate-specific enzyme activase [Petrotoga mobilis]|nr:MAG: CoA-substrate-specific enzyme activase [Petrotoga mobilis]